MSTLRPVKVMIPGATPATARRHSTISTAMRNAWTPIGQEGGIAASSRSRRPEAMRASAPSSGGPTASSMWGGNA